MKPTLANLRKLVARHGGTIERDGMGGYDLLASPPGVEPMMRWINAEVWCQPLPLGELDREERLERIEEVMMSIEGGTEPYDE